ncbi:MAG: protein-disulfide reductase DsbD, partial [bacterium]
PEAGKVRVTWHIEDGYYLYQSKFRFTSTNDSVVLGDPKLPKAEIKDDPFFGKIEIYRGRLDVDIPITLQKADESLLELQVRSQGCADAGICYPPHTQTVLLALNHKADQPPPVSRAAIEDMEDAINSPSGSGNAEITTASNPIQAISDLGQSLGFGDDDILPAEEAFKFFASVKDAKNLQLRWDIADGTYLYEDKIRLELKADGVQIGEYQLPPPEIKENSITPEGTIGDVPVYHNVIDLPVPLLRSNTAATSIQLTAHYQGCADRGICYPPSKTLVSLDLPAADAADDLSQVAQASPGQGAASAAAGEQAEHDQIAGLLKDGSTWFIVMTFFGIGLLLAFTPCVFPMIPILSGIIAGHGDTITTRKAFWLSLVYVLAMAITYTIAGVLAGMFGANLQAAFQNPWILSSFSVVFVLLALSMFGFYDLQLPASWQGRLAEISNRQEGGSMAGVAIMGLLSALIVGPCVAPPLAGALIYIGQSGDAILGGLALFAMSMGMGAPLIAIGTSAGKLLPRAGAWMDAVKGVFGVAMLGIAIMMLERIIPAAAAMLLWGTLLIVSGVYMGATQSLAADASGWRKLWKGLGLALVAYGIAFLIGVAAGGKDTLQPLRGIVVGGGGAAEAHVSFKRIKSIDDLNKELAAAKASGTPVMLDFYADWCVYCIQMEKNTFPAPAVSKQLDTFVLLQADVTDQDDIDKALQAHIGIPAPPAMIFWGADGAEQRNLRLLGYMGPEDFAQHISKVKR